MYLQSDFLLTRVGMEPSCLLFVAASNTQLSTVLGGSHRVMSKTT